MHDAIDHRCGRRRVEKDLTPLRKRQIRRHDEASPHESAAAAMSNGRSTLPKVRVPLGRPLLASRTRRAPFAPPFDVGSHSFRRERARAVESD
jgi:hypothetical protein